MSEPQWVELQPRHLVGIRRKVPVTELAPYFAEVLPKVMGWVVGQGVTPASMPMAVWWSMDRETGIADVQAGCFVSEALAGEGEITAATTPGGRAVHLLHTGGYDNMGQSWMAAYGAVAKAGEQPGSGWEIYEDDPTAVPEDQVRTGIYLPVL